MPAVGLYTFWPIRYKCCVEKNLLINESTIMSAAVKLITNERTLQMLQARVTYSFLLSRFFQDIVANPFCNRDDPMMRREYSMWQMVRIHTPATRVVSGWNVLT